MANQQLLGGPSWEVVTNPTYALYADAHYFIQSGSVVRTNPWNSPTTPIAKILNVTNITANDVAVNYVSSSGVCASLVLTSGSSTQITSQTIPLGMDNTPWISSSIVSDFTGSITARTTGSRWFGLEAIRTVSDNTNVYFISNGSSTISTNVTGFPTSGSLVYRCSRTIPYLDKPYWRITDLYDCTGGTTTTTTTTSTTTTTTSTTSTTTTTAAPFCNVWTASNAFGAGYEIRVKYCGDTSYSFPTVPANSSIYVCVQNDQIDNNGNPITLTSSSVSCTGSIITTTTTTTTAAPTTTTTTTAAPTTTTTSTTSTTTTLASQKYYVESCSGPGDIVGVITITSAPLLTAGQIIRLNTNVAGLSCFQVYSTSTGTSTLGTRSVTNIYTDCVDCTD
jgi:hypothetical protein